MDSLEILKSLKQMWEIWFDLHENTDCLSDSIYQTFESTLSKKYSMQYSKMLEEEPEKLSIGTFKGKELIIADIVGVDYICKDAPVVCFMGGDVNYHWWNDSEVNPLKQNEKEVF